ncbi:MAG: TerB family tellurite resistance protein, partial [Bacteroidales bacterium]|nr:TerB family tellurite resistance protein [Bacteroidales bacterium]
MLTQNQKIAFTSILIEMANADGLIDARECVAVKKILSSLGVDNETFLLAREIPLPLAIDVMENASTEGKIF